jgi:hypothetical protein
MHHILRMHLKKGLNAVELNLSLTPTENISAYINFMDGSVSGTSTPTATFQLTDEISRSECC